MDVNTILRDSEGRMKKTKDAIVKEFSAVSGGRASPGLVEAVKVEYYGTSTPLKQLATISTPEPRLIVIHPWDPSALAEVEKAILQSDLGFNPSNDGKFIRINIPHLTDERRNEIIKIASRVAEEGKVSLRTVRHEANDLLKEAEKRGEIPEDERFRLQEKIQKLTDKYNKEIDKILEDKEEEITEG